MINSVSDLKQINIRHNWIQFLYISGIRCVFFIPDKAHYYKDVDHPKLSKIIFDFNSRAYKFGKVNLIPGPSQCHQNYKK